MYLEIRIDYSNSFVLPIKKAIKVIKLLEEAKSVDRSDYSNPLLSDKNKEAEIRYYTEEEIAKMTMAKVLKTE